MGTHGPPEPPGGQDGPPDLRLALLVAVVLLADLDDHLGGRGGRDVGDLRLRIAAVRAVLNRIREARADDG